MENKIEKRGRKALPKGEKKTRVYILVKEKYKKKAQKLIDKIATDLNN